LGVPDGEGDRYPEDDAASSALQLLASKRVVAPMLPLSTKASQQTRYLTEYTRGVV
jgi:hypothetical protein